MARLIKVWHSLYSSQHFFPLRPVIIGNHYFVFLCVKIMGKCMSMSCGRKTGHTPFNDEYQPL